MHAAILVMCRGRLIQTLIPPSQGGPHKIVNDDDNNNDNDNDGRRGMGIL